MVKKKTNKQTKKAKEPSVLAERGVVAEVVAEEAAMPFWHRSTRASAWTPLDVIFSCCCWRARFRCSIMA